MIESNVSRESANKSSVDFVLLPALLHSYCRISEGTDCSKIGMVRCECYCTASQSDCTKVKAEKMAQAFLAILEMAADIGMAVASGGTSLAATAAKNVAK